MFHNTLTVCPECGERTVVPVVYGYPGPTMFEAVERNAVILGGCVVPRRYSHGCTACGWRDRVAFLPQAGGYVPGGRDCAS